MPSGVANVMIRVAYGAPLPHGGGALNYLVDLVEHHNKTWVHANVYLDERLRNADDALARLARADVGIRRGLITVPLRDGLFRRNVRESQA